MTMEGRPATQPTYSSIQDKEGETNVAPERHTHISILGAVRVEDSGGIKARIKDGLWNFGMPIILHNPSIITAHRVAGVHHHWAGRVALLCLGFLCCSPGQRTGPPFSSYLFSQTIRHAIVVYLTRPLSVSTLGFGILISRRSLIFDRQLKWVFVAAIFFLATLGQTASWTSLLTPIDILIPTPLKGTEIDLSSKAFSDQFQQLWVSDLQDYINGPLLSIIDASGATSATSQAGYPGVLDFAGWAHDISTRGIFPIQIVNSEDINNANTTHLVTVNTKPFPPTGFSRNISMSQHGLTATVSCQNQDLDGTTNPPLFRFADPAEITLDGESYSYTATSLSTTCSNGDTVSSGKRSSQALFISPHIFKGTQLTSTNNTLLAERQPTVRIRPLGYVPFADASFKAVIIDGQGQQYDYMKTVYIYTNFDESYPRIDAGPVGSAALYGLLAGFAYGQNEIRNVVGDSITSIFTDQVFEQETPTAFLELLVTLGLSKNQKEAYITGIVEFVGTVEYDKAITGTTTTATVGWEYSSTASYGFLLPIIFVALASIFIALFAQYQNRGIPVHHADFDPNQPLRLMAALLLEG
ncbi:hypothetical protein B0H10DRAFT_1958131 [Mycena sp. CBHHK59/15]|nr:hypothetical protein B0H10DRAFT_1958131 [Mycena sp. CBHHK59/15]